MAKVWISNYAGHDFSAAEKYGVFDYITKGYVSFQSLDRVKYEIATQVAKSHKDDWFLISGKPIISCVAILLWFQLHKQVKILHWDHKGEGTYRELIITARNLDEILGVLGVPIYKSIAKETEEFQNEISNIHRQRIDGAIDSRKQK